MRISRGSARIFRGHAHGRGSVAPHRRYHADKIRGRFFRFDCPAQSVHVFRLRHHAGLYKSGTERACRAHAAGSHCADDCFWPHGAAFGARQSGQNCRYQRACRRNHIRYADCQSFTHEVEDRRVYAHAVENSFDTAKLRILARSGMTAIAIVLVFAGVVGILWVGAQNVVQGTMTAGTLGQFIIYAVLCATSIGALSEVWGEVQLAAGATERLVEILQLHRKSRHRPILLPLPSRCGAHRF